METQKIENIQEIIKEKPKRKQTIPRALKIQIWDKWIGIDKGTSKCLCCNVSDINQQNFACGHIIAESNGGEITVDNLKPVCTTCNSSMGTMNMNDFIQQYFLANHKGGNKTLNVDTLKNIIKNTIKEVTKKAAKNAVKIIPKSDPKNIIKKSVYYCKCCKYYTHKLSNFKNHIVSQKHITNFGENNDKSKDLHTKKAIYCCDKCDNVYLSNQYLQKHINSKHYV